LLRTYLVPINRAGWPFIAALAVLAVVGAAYSQPLGWIGAIATAWCTYFFRDPDRVVPIREGLVVSPADGRVSSVGRASPPPELEMGERPYNRVSVFMDIFDVHVNRIPISGRVVASHYRPGKFVNASLDKSSEDNERHSIHLMTPDGTPIGCVQIAGLVARRISCDVAPGQEVEVGRRYGLIRFGSRLDIYVPAEVPILVAPGQHSYAGETVLADLRSTEPPRPTELR
jgi:phosphatidylserine decarboxylase